MKKIKKVSVSLLVVISVLLSCIAPFSFGVKALSNEETIFNYLTETMGLNTAAACGVLANIQCESSFNPNVLGDGGTSYGICQWHNDRWTKLKNYASNWQTLSGQLSYLSYELSNDYPSVLSYLKSVSNDSNGAYNAGYYWCYHFEVPANRDTVSVTRGNLAKNTYWPKYGSTVSHTRDTNYGTEFTAYLKNPGTNHYVQDANHNNTGGYVNGTDPVTIHEVYTDGCCKITYLLDSGTYRTAYGKISWFDTTTRNTKLISWITTKGDGYTYLDAFPTVDNGTTQTLYYFWFAILDANTNDLYNSYRPGKSYTVTMSVKYEDGSEVRSTYTYTNSDANWVGFTPKKSGKITATATVAGDIKGSTSASFTIDYSAGLKRSASSVSLNIQGTNTKTLTFTPTGGYPGSKGMRKTVDTDIVNIDSSGWSDGVYSITLSGKKNGTTSLEVELYENYTENKTVVARATVSITVTGGTFTLTYNADGGSPTPSSQKGTSLTITSTKPTKSGYKFLGWSTTSSGTPEYQSGDNITLSEDTTLYASWARSSTAPYWGDVNNDTYVDYQDADILLKIRQKKITPTTEQSCFLDFNLDGSTNGQDALDMLLYREGQEDTFPAATDAEITFNPPSKTSYKVGESLNTSGMKVIVSNKNDSSVKYELTNNISVTGYNSSSTGKQTLTATYRGMTFHFDVTVVADSYTLHYDAKGGSGVPGDQTGSKTYTISSTVPTRFGYTFLGWSTSSTATSATYVPGSNIALTQNTTLYAVWKAASTINIGSVYPVDINFGYQGWYYKFTPSSSGTYIFESTGSLDTKVSVYNTSGSQLGSNDDGGSGNNFKLEIALTSGTTYYVYVGAYGSKTGSTAFTVSQKQTIKKGDLNGDDEVDAGDAVLISRYDAGLITLTSAQLQAGDLNGDGYVDAGDAVIISRYDAGLISTI